MIFLQVDDEQQLFMDGEAITHSAVTPELLIIVSGQATPQYKS